jgi:hypothetical protein
VLYAASARDPHAPPDFFDGLQLLLVVSALVVDGVALWAIAARISEFGFTPNRWRRLARTSFCSSTCVVGVALCVLPRQRGSFGPPWSDGRSPICRVYR